jgi:hypothetical protein
VGERLLLTIKERNRLGDFKIVLLLVEGASGGALSLYEHGHDERDEVGGGGGGKGEERGKGRAERRKTAGREGDSGHYIYINRVEMKLVRAWRERRRRRRRIWRGAIVEVLSPKKHAPYAYGVVKTTCRSFTPVVTLSYHHPMPSLPPRPLVHKVDHSPNSAAPISDLPAAAEKNSQAPKPDQKTESHGHSSQNVFFFKNEGVTITVTSYEEEFRKHKDSTWSTRV